MFRFVVLLLTFGAVVSFALFALTGQQRFKRFGLAILKWSIVAAFIFFAVLIAERLTAAPRPERAGVQVLPPSTARAPQLLPLHI